MSDENYQDTKYEKINNNEDNKTDKKKHEIDKDKGKPDFTPDKEKIKGPTHASSAQDKVTTGIESNEFDYNPFKKF
jgi:hypothetical protein